MDVAAAGTLLIAQGGPRRPWRRGLAWLAFLAPFFYLTYGLANYLTNLRGNVGSVVFQWERSVPFWAWTIFPYWSINLFYGLSLLLCRSRHELDRHALRLLTAQVVAVSFFILLPLSFSFGQPPADGAAGWLFAALRGFDKPFNQAPSLHIALAVILWDLYRRFITNRAARIVLHAWTLLICASVLTTYQHHFFDLPTGAALGLLCVWAWPLERRAPPWRGLRWSADAQRRKLAACYAAGAAACLLAALFFGGAALWLGWPALALALVALNYAALGARGFGKHRLEGTPWALRCLLAPYRAAAWLNSRWWTRAHADAVQIAPGVWLGRVPGAERDPRWNSAVDLTAELDAPAGTNTLCLPALDLVTPGPAWLRRAALAIERQYRAHGSVLVFCALGYSRSAAAVAAWLVTSGRSADVDQALAVVRQARPQVMLRQPLRDALAAAVEQFR
jgi:protein-tyrosine phosphatase